MKSNKDKFELKEVKRPVLMCKQLSDLEIQRSQSEEYFLISTIDSYLLFYVYNSELGFQQILKVQTPSPVCEAFINKNSEIYFGSYHGDIGIIRKGKIEKVRRLSKCKTEFLQIELIYQVGKVLYVWNLNNEVYCLEPGTLKKYQEYKFEQHIITSSISMLNPLNKHLSACVSFNNQRPPILFDDFQFQKSLSIQGKIHEKQQNQVDGQIIKMAYEYNSHNYLVCGIRKSQKQFSISLFCVQYEDEEEQGFCCRPSFTFLLDEGQIFRNISQRFGFLLIVVKGSLMMLDLQTEYKKQVIKTRKKDGLKELSWAFTLRKKDGIAELLFFKGFNYENQKDFEKGHPVFYISLKKYHYDDNQ